MLCSDAAPADKDAHADANTADSYGDDPLPPPVLQPPPTPGEAPGVSASHVHSSFLQPSCGTATNVDQGVSWR